MPKSASSIVAHTAALKARHADLEMQIANETARPHPDDSVIASLKKAKLRLKDSLSAVS